MRHHPCKVPGCRLDAASQYGVYCHSHRTRLRRHGAVTQQAITKADLKLYRAHVRTRFEKNRDGPLAEQVLAQWHGLVKRARGFLDDYSGKPTIGPAREAARELVKLGLALDAMDAVETVLAMYLMADAEPRRFAGHEGFLAQLVRRLRGLTTLNASTYLNPTTGREVRVYREMSPRAVRYMAGWIVEALGIIGLRFAKLDREDHEAQREATNALCASLRSAR